MAGGAGVADGGIIVGAYSVDVRGQDEEGVNSRGIRESQTQQLAQEKHRPAFSWHRELHRRGLFKSKVVGLGGAEVIPASMTHNGYLLSHLFSRVL